MSLRVLNKRCDLNYGEQKNITPEKENNLFLNFLNEIIYRNNF